MTYHKFLASVFAGYAVFSLSSANDPQQTASPLQASRPEAQGGIWISPSELANLSIDNEAWKKLFKAASQEIKKPDLSNQDDPTNVRVMSKALVYARTQQTRFRDEVREALHTVVSENTEEGGRTLALARELPAYIIAADLIGLKNFDPRLDAAFRAKLRELREKKLGNRTIVSTHETRPNNWGTHAGACRVAIAVYLNDRADLERSAMIFKAWLGDRSQYTGFKFGELSWQADSTKPVGINPKGARRNGHSIDGVLPDDQRRGGIFAWPPPKENYVYESLQGALVQAVILHRAGYDVWEWCDRALLRAYQWLYQEAKFPAQGDDEWQIPLVNYFYGTDFPVTIPARTGKNAGWTDWTHVKKIAP